MAKWTSSALNLMNQAGSVLDAEPESVVGAEEMVTESVPLESDVVGDISVEPDNVAVPAGVGSDAVTESIKIQLSNGLESYFIANANGEPVTDSMVNRLYVQSQFVDGEISGEEYTKQLADIGNNLYVGADDAAAWIASVSRDNNPWHYEPVKTGRTYGSSAAKEADISNIQVDVSKSGLGIDTALSQEQLNMINALNGTGKKELSSEEKTTLYAKLVSDNYSANNDITELCDGDVTKLTKEQIDSQAGNLVVNDGQDVMLDVSEMSVGRKTKLEGAVKKTSVDGQTAEEWLKEEYERQLSAAEDSEDDAKIDAIKSDGVSMDVCGGTLTYKNNGNDFHFKSDYLGEFDYNTKYYNLAYKTGETTVDGEKQEISVPILHANNFEYDDDHYFAFWENPGENSDMNPPKGLKVGDYMFDGCDKLEAMPPLPNSLTSGHAMFSGCSKMKRVSVNAKEGANTNWNLFFDWGGNYGKGGEVNAMPSNMEDVSYMFSDCTKMSEPFDKMGSKVWDARGMYQNCENVDTMIDMTNCKYLLTEMAAGMYTGGNTNLQKKVEEYVEQNNGSVSQWTGDGAKNHLSDRIQDGLDVTDPKWTAWQKMVDANRLIESEDPTGGGATTGLEALTAGLSSYGVQRTADGNCYADDSTWATLREDYRAPEDSGAPNTELLDKGLAFGGTFLLSSGILSGVTKSKWVGLLGGAAIAGGLQYVGVANKISPFLRTVGGLVGENSLIGKGLNGLAEKLEGSKSDDTVSDVLSVEELFDNRQTETKKYTEATLMTLTNTETNSKVGAGFYMKQITTMEENGHLLAQDGNLDVIAYTSESEYQKSCNSAVMSTACDGMMQHIQELAGESGSLTDVQKQELGNAFIVMMQNVKAYSNGAEDAIKENSDPEKMDRMTAGLGKVMRNTTDPVYSLICQADEQYGILTEEQKSVLDSMAPAGTSTFSEYQASFDYDTKVGDIGAPSVDVYVAQLQSGVQEAASVEKQMESSGASEQDVHTKRLQYLEQNYGWMMDLAEEHSVKYSTGLEDLEEKPKESEEAQLEK